MPARRRCGADFSIEPGGDRIGRTEPDAPHVAGQPVRILGHHLDGLVTVGLEDADRTRRADAVRVQEDHDLAHGLLFGPARHDLRGSPRADAGDLGEALGMGFDDVEGRFAERSDDALGHGGADAPHLAECEILLDSVRAGRRRGLEDVGLELEPMSPVADPGAARGDPLPRPDEWRVSDDDRQAAPPPNLHLQNAEAAFGIVEGHALDRAGQGFRRRTLMRGDGRTMCS